jgi:hypothetical protein
VEEKETVGGAQATAGSWFGAIKDRAMGLVGAAQQKASL